MFGAKEIFKKASSSKKSQCLNQESAPILDGINWPNAFNYDVVKDANAMLKILEEKQEKKSKMLNGRMNQSMDIDDSYDEESDSDDESEINETNKKVQGCNVTHGVIHKDRTVIMTKVDVSRGFYGLYNFL